MLVQTWPQKALWIGKVIIVSLCKVAYMCNVAYVRYLCNVAYVRCNVAYVRFIIGMVYPNET